MRYLISFSDVDSMDVEILESSSEDELVTPSCDTCGYTTRSWTIHFCHTCGRRCHYQCMKGKWICDSKIWTCDRCSNPLSNGHSICGVAEGATMNVDKAIEEGKGKEKEKEERETVVERPREKPRDSPSVKRLSLPPSRKRERVASPSMDIELPKTSDLEGLSVREGYDLRGKSDRRSTSPLGGSEKRKCESEGNLSKKRDSEPDCGVSEWQQMKRRMESRQSQFTENALRHLDRDHQFCICRSEIRSLYIPTPDWRKRKVFSSSSISQDLNFIYYIRLTGRGTPARRGRQAVH